MNKIIDGFFPHNQVIVPWMDKLQWNWVGRWNLKFQEDMVKRKRYSPEYLTRMNLW